MTNIPGLSGCGGLFLFKTLYELQQSIFQFECRRVKFLEFLFRNLFWFSVSMKTWYRLSKRTQCYIEKVEIFTNRTSAISFRKRCLMELKPPPFSFGKSNHTFPLWGIPWLLDRSEAPLHLPIQTLWVLYDHACFHPAVPQPECLQPIYLSYSYCNRKHDPITSSFLFLGTRVNHEWLIT